MKALQTLVILGMTLSVVPGLCAQGDQHKHRPESGDPAQLGEVHFPISCSSDAQQQFNRAVAMLHSFWYQEAEKAFAHLARTEPDCAMAYWGVAMSRFRQLWERPTAEDLKTGEKALERARAAGTRSDRERAYIHAIGQFYENAQQVDHLERVMRYEKAMEELRERFPGDSEAGIFYALSVLSTAYASPADKSYVRQKKAGGILETIFARQTNHPGVAHYIIHSYDYPQLAERALEAARRYAKIAPQAPHALHMPSHIFTRLGLWQESIASNRAAAAAARRVQWTGEELHAMDYLTYAHLQRAQDDEGGKILDSLPRTRGHLRDHDSNYPAGIYAAAAIPARIAIERRQWNEAAALAWPAQFFPQGRFCWAEAGLYFAQGLGAARTGDPEQARRASRRLEQCREDLRRANERLWANRVEAQRRAVQAWSSLAEGRRDEALAAMRSAAELEDDTDKSPISPGAIIPARELLGEMLLELKRPAEALEAFEALLEDSPNRFNAFYGAARAAELVGSAGKAREYYARLAALAEGAESQRAALRHAKAVLNNGRN